MNFDANRLARLAGLPVSEAKTLTEAGNRSRREDAGVSDESDFRYGKGQIAEDAADSETKTASVDLTDVKAKIEANKKNMEQVKALLAMMDDVMNLSNEDKTSAMEMIGKDWDQYMLLQTALKNLDDAMEPAGTEEPLPEMDDYAEEMDIVDIDESMLQNEIKKMRNERIEENALRNVIRGEIGSILGDLKKNKNKSTKRSKEFDGLTKGFPGPGFR